MTDGNRRMFSSTEHLASEAVAAYVDGELGPIAVERAEAHLRACPECLADVAAQQHARGALHQVRSSDVAAPSSLVGALSNIPKKLLCDPQPAADSRRWGLPWRK